MVKIALVGNDNAENISKVLTSLLKMAGKSVFSYNSTKYGTFKQLAHDAADVFIAPVKYYLLEQSKENIDILVFSNNSPPFKQNLNLINENAFVIISAEDNKAQKYLKGSAANLLTYGFNPKASITASSIEQNMEKNFIQICIQRSFQTISGTPVEAQEFPITLSAAEEIGVLDEIAAITTALALGINIRTISLAY